MIERYSGLKILEFIYRKINNNFVQNQKSVNFKGDFQAVNSSQKKNEFVSTTIRRVLDRFLEEIEGTKRTFRN